MRRQSLTDRAQTFIREAVSPGDRVIDATLGNGHDTLFLARQVGAGGRVYGFDVQPEALERTQRRLMAAGQERQVTLFHRGHEAMGEALPPRLEGHIRAIMFNLGYLPRGDKGPTTLPETTLKALDSCKALLSPGGRMTILAYTGHPGGDREAEAVERWIALLNPSRWRCLSILPDTDHDAPPRLYCCERQGEKTDSP